MKIHDFGTVYYFPADYRDFIGFISLQFKIKLKELESLLIENILSHIPITETAFYLDGPKKWVIPVSFKASKIAKEESIVLIECHPSDVFTSKMKVESIVNSAVCDIVSAKETHNIPGNYPQGCLVLNPIESISGFSESLYNRISVYIIRYTLLSPSGISFETFSCNDYNSL
jgi:hypothetical protein